MSLVLREDDGSESGKSVAIVAKQAPRQKVLEEEEYLGRMAQIIKRDFFNASETPASESSTGYTSSTRTDKGYLNTPGSTKTNYSTSSSMRSRNASCSLRLDHYLEKYTSEDNAYFEKLQRKELKRHRLKFPWLYKDRNNHNKAVGEQTKLPPAQPGLGSSSSASNMIDWPFNPRNALFYPKSDPTESGRQQSTVNYESSRLMQEPVFKEPLPVRPQESRLKGQPVFSNKIGIDGNLIGSGGGGSETPNVNGYSFIPAPETPARNLALADSMTSVKLEPRYHMPIESARDELANRLYEEKVAKRIRTPKSSTRSDSTRANNTNTPGSSSSMKWKF